jgi:hypothetical protein
MVMAKAQRRAGARAASVLVAFGTVIGTTASATAGSSSSVGSSSHLVASAPQTSDDYPAIITSAARFAALTATPGLLP